MQLYSADTKTCIDLEVVFCSKDKAICKIQRLNSKLDETKQYKKLIEMVDNDNFMSISFGYDGKVAMVTDTDFLKCDDTDYIYLEISYTTNLYKVSSKGYLHHLHNSWLTSLNPVHQQIKQLLEQDDTSSNYHQNLIDNHIRHYLDKTVIDTYTGKVFYYDSLHLYAKALFILKGLIKPEHWEYYAAPNDVQVPAEYNKTNHEYTALNCNPDYGKYGKRFAIDFKEVEDFYFDCRKYSIDITNIEGV